MMVWLVAHAATLAATAAMLFAATVLLVSRETAHRAGMRRLAAADRLLADHASLLRRFVEADAVPNRLKGELLSFSAAAVDDETFSAIWRDACARISPERGVSVLDRDLADLYALDPDLGSCFERAVFSLAAAMVLKSQDLVDHPAEAIAGTHSRALFASAIDARRRKDGGLLMPDGGLLPA